MTKELFFNLQDYSQATFAQNFVASIGGAVASITVAAPLDVVKTRVQQANFENSVGGMTVIREMIKKEGAGAFFKGLTPKVRPRTSLFTLPRLVALPACSHEEDSESCAPRRLRCRVVS